MGSVSSGAGQGFGFCLGVLVFIFALFALAVVSCA